MAYDEITALLGGWEGFEIVGVDGENDAVCKPHLTV